MCRELEVMGLPNPCFNNDTFILKTTVKSAAFDHESTQNMPIGAENVADSTKNMPIDAESVLR